MQILKRNKDQQQTKIVTQTIEKQGPVQIVEVEKQVPVIHEKVIKVEVPSQIKGKEFQDLHKDIKALPESINSLKNYFDRTNASKSTARLELEFDKLQRTLLQTVNGLKAESTRIHNEDSKEITAMISTVERLRQEVRNIKLDASDKTKTVIEQAIFPLSEKIYRMNDLTEVKASIDALNILVKDLVEKGEPKHTEFDELLKLLNDQVNKGVKLDPEIKAYYTMFAERIRDLEYITNKLRANEETSLGLIHRYNSYIDDLNDRTKNIENSITATMKEVQDKVQHIQIKMDMVNKTVVEQVNFVSTYNDLPDPVEFESTKMFVVNTTRQGYWFKWKGMYMSTGEEWVPL